MVVTVPACGRIFLFFSQSHEGLVLNAKLGKAPPVIYFVRKLFDGKSTKPDSEVFSEPSGEGWESFGVGGFQKKRPATCRPFN
jgi:hypothetical protein